MSDIKDDPPSITESESGRIVGQQVDVEDLKVEVLIDGTARVVVSGMVPNRCYEAVIGFEEPNSEGVLVGSAESWLDDGCTAESEPQEFEEWVEFANLRSGNYLARLDKLEAKFTIP